MSVTPRGAVFLSYASQDADAAKRICDALRATGVEVWFDKNELVGGDAWDQKIRRQIRECTLFVPIISENTNARAEGYFRREWKLAVERTHDMADDLPFLVPVVLGEVTDAAARVPDRFREVQWTRMSDDVPPGFAPRVARLLAGTPEPRPAVSAPSAVGEAGVTDYLRDTAAAARDSYGGLRQRTRNSYQRLSRPARWTITGVMLLAGIGCGMLLPRLVRPEPVGPLPSPVVPATTEVLHLDAKARATGLELENSHTPDSAAAKVGAGTSIAVLAFANLSDDKANEYFSDGISEELLTVLQKIPGLKVSARTSAFSFKGRDIPVREVGRALGVAYVVEGSVRKAGNQVRISARLSRAVSGEQVWADSYTRDLADIFALQTELAHTIVGRVRGRLTAGEDAELAGRLSAAEQGGTTDPAAHEFFLRGRYFASQPTMENMARAMSLFQQAVDRDPRYALAWAALGRTIALEAQYLNTSLDDIREKFARARTAADRALELQPNLPEAWCTRFEIQAAYDFDWRGARESINRAVAAAPSDALLISNLSQIEGCFGNLERSVQLGRQAIELDPVNTEVRYWLAWTYLAAGRLGEAEAELNRVEELGSSILVVHRRRSLLFVLQGRIDAAVQEAGRETLEWSRLTAQAVAFAASGDRVASEAARTKLVEVAAHSAAFQVAEIHAFRGENDEAFAWLERSLANRDPGLAQLLLDPLLRNIRTDRRWPVFVRKVGLSEDQLR